MQTKCSPYFAQQISACSMAGGWRLVLSIFFIHLRCDVSVRRNRWYPVILNTVAHSAFSCCVSLLRSRKIEMELKTVWRKFFVLRNAQNVMFKVGFRCSGKSRDMMTLCLLAFNSSRIVK